MRPVLSRDEVRRLDAWAVSFAQVPSLILMENAGRGAAARILAGLGGSPRASRGAPPKIVVVCGTGNNGGDGLVAARHFRIAGVEPEVFLVGKPQTLKGDARANHYAYELLGGTVESVDTDADVSRLEAALSKATIVVDALFGTGLDRPITGLAAKVIAAINAAHLTRIALDLPSGIDADNGSIHGVAVDAHATVTFAHPKLGLLTPGGARHAGDVALVHIGIPGALPPEIRASAELLEESDIRAWAKPRDVGGHKYSAGHVTVFAGSPGHVGAASMVAHAAMRAGAGLVTIATWPEVATQLEGRVVEIMTARLSEKEGELEASIDAALVKKAAVVVGPGLGTNDAAERVVRHLLASCDLPVVLDADALTIAARDLDTLKGSAARAPRILTPHAGEMGRLLGCEATAVEADRFAAVRKAVLATGCTVVLKGAYTLVGSKEGDGVRVIVAGGAVPALATAGAGDVLAGIIGGLVPSLGPVAAACTGVFVHARAAERWAESNGDRGLLASEVADLVPAMLRELVPGLGPFAE